MNAIEIVIDILGLKLTRKVNPFADNKKGHIEVHSWWKFQEIVNVIDFDKEPTKGVIGQYSRLL